MITLLNLLAQTTAPSSAPAPTGGGGDPLAFWRSFFPLILVLGVFWWIMSRSRSKERQRFQQMLSALKRNDRVQTIGGILATVVDVREDEVVLKVDEASNVKIRVNRSAIKEVLRDTAAPAESK
jgi:preprotein translocase subunit YajC